MMDTLSKIYIEPTNRCNLKCVTCIRNSWEDSNGEMDWSVYQSFIDGLSVFPGLKTIAFAGLGEPLLHGKFLDMIQLAHGRGLRTEMTSNALLLTPDLSKELLQAGLDQLVVSVDGASNETYGDIRPGASLDGIIANVRRLHLLSARTKMAPIRIGIEFVAMKRNIRELPKLGTVARRMGASFILVTNVLPYTADLQDEILYNSRPGPFEAGGSPIFPLWMLPNIDFNTITEGPLLELARKEPNLSFLDVAMGQRDNYCPFIRVGAIAVAWHGGVSPCPPLMHTYSCYIRNRKKKFIRYEIGSLKDKSLKDIWMDSAFEQFRGRVINFDFPPCTDCGGCIEAETNETDCYNNPFPVCGDCLWAKGVLRCA